jgi:hypothetical protein
LPFWQVAAVLVLLVLEGAPAAKASSARPSMVRLAIPIDTDAPGAWLEAIAGAPSVGTVILNPENGPGANLDSGYAQLVRRAQSVGISVLGYVYTQWADGNVSAQQAEGWIDQYYTWYHVDGIMLDEANDTCASVPLRYYQTLYDYIKAKSPRATVMLNPGTAVGECYAQVSDVLLTFEDNYSSYLFGYAGSNWTAGYPPSHFFHIVFGVPTAAEMLGVVSMAVSRGAGWVFVTDLNDSDGNPYNSLPSYFGQEVSYVAGLDHLSRASPIPMPALAIVGLTATGSVLLLVSARRKP